MMQKLQNWKIGKQEFQYAFGLSGSFQLCEGSVRRVLTRRRGLDNIFADSDAHSLGF